MKRNRKFNPAKSEASKSQKERNEESGASEAKRERNEEQRKRNEELWGQDKPPYPK